MSPICDQNNVLYLHMKKQSSSNGLKIILIVIFVSFLLKLISGQYNISLFKSEPTPGYNKDINNKIKKIQELGESLQNKN